MACKICGKTGFYRVGKKEYCEEHKNEATEHTKKVGYRILNNMIKRDRIYNEIKDNSRTRYK